MYMCSLIFSFGWVLFLGLLPTHLTAVQLKIVQGNKLCFVAKHNRRAQTLYSATQAYLAARTHAHLQHACTHANARMHACIRAPTCALAHKCDVSIKKEKTIGRCSFLFMEIYIVFLTFLTRYSMLLMLFFYQQFLPFCFCSVFASNPALSCFSFTLRYF